VNVKSLMSTTPKVVSYGRDTQFKLTTTNGAVFVGTVVMGQNAG